MNNTIEELKNDDDFIIIWLSSNNLPDEMINLNYSLIKLNSNEKSIDYIKQNKSKILLILTDWKILPKFEDLIQIQWIFIFQENNQNIQLNKTNHRKLIGIYNNIIDLRQMILLICQRYLPIQISSLNQITIQRSLTNLHGNSLSFVLNQIFVYYLINSSDVNMEESKRQMLEQCRLEYQDNQIELKKIDEFDKTCSNENVLEWYSKDSFLFRLLNKTFRTQNIELIHKYQYFIILLYKKFEELSKKQENINPSIVYRGQFLDENSIENLKLNIGNFISINTFMSTSLNENIARIFIPQTSNGVIFKINISNHIYNSFKPFIDISNLSSMQDEEEILFFPQTVFSVISVQLQDDSTYVIELNLHNNTWKHIEIWMPIILKRINTLSDRRPLFTRTDDYNMIDLYYSLLTDKTFSMDNDHIIMGYIHVAFALSNYGSYNEAIEFYENAILAGKFSIDCPQSIVLHIIIGYLYYHLSDYNNAFLHYGIVLSLLNHTHLLTGELYGHIGDVWYKIENDDFALSCYEEASIITNNHDIPSLPNIYRNLSDIHRKKGNFDRANFYEKKLEEIDRDQYHLEIQTSNDDLLEQLQNQLTESDNLTLAERVNILYRMGLCLMKGNYFDEALIILLEVKELISNERQLNNDFLGILPTLFDNIAALYLFRKDYLRALLIWKKSIDIRTNN